VLLQKVHTAGLLEEFGEFLKELCRGLRVELTDFGLVENDWVKAKVSGEDEAVAVRFLEREVGLAPVSVENVRRFSVLRGSVIFSRQSKMEVLVDAGVFSPKPVYAVVPLQRLQGQLADGRKLALKQIIELFGLVDDFPLEVRMVKTGEEALEAELTEGQLGLYGRWVGMRVDRLVVLGALLDEVREAVDEAGLERDVIEVESLGVLEHAVVCKLGTDAEGLVSRLGRWLSTAGFVCFSPRRVLSLLSGR
jgi:hypothetical protein